MSGRRRITEEVQDAVNTGLEEEINEKETVEQNKKLLKRQNLLSSGSTIVNLACTNTPHGYLLAGKYYLFVGESEAGKTWLSMTTLAESTLHPRFRDFKIVYDNVEAGANMDMDFYFGKATAARIEAPEPDRIDKLGVRIPYSVTAEQFYDSINRHLDLAEEGGYGIIYILDSMDSLTTEAELKKSKSDQAARIKELSGGNVKDDGEEEEGTGGKRAGSYGDGKAKVNSANLRRVVSRLGRSNSILIIISQERDDLGSRFGGSTFSGGHALKFYATLQLWLKKKEDINCVIRGKKRALGSRSELGIFKNRLTGEKNKKIDISIYHSFGIDEVGSMIDWLLSEGYWTGGRSDSQKIKAVDFDVELDKEKLVRHIEENNLEDKLRDIVCALWVEIGELIAKKVQRKRRYE
jgi:RecA/RadA recombinase